jgi:hypothetical protein
MTSSLAARRTAAASAEQTALALQRLDQLAEMDERLRRRRPRFRVAKLTAALATWATVAILVADTQLWTSLPV